MTTGALVVVARLGALEEGRLVPVRARGVDLVLVRRGAEISVFYGRCPHRGAPMADARIEGPDLVCAAHGWDFCSTTGISRSSPGDRLHRFDCTIDEPGDAVLVPAMQLDRFFVDHPQAFDPDEHLGG